MDKENIENQRPESLLGVSSGPTAHVSAPAITDIVITGAENDEVTKSSVAPKRKTQLKVNIRSWNGVAVWKWLANDDTCGICRVAFDGCCPDCKFAGDDCPLVWGECSHCFHIHCIEKWLSSQQQEQKCPMCRQDWKYKE